MKKMRVEILFELINTKNGTLSKNELMKRMDMTKKKERNELQNMLGSMQKRGDIEPVKNGMWKITDKSIFFKARVAGINSGWGFVAAVPSEENDKLYVSKRLDGETFFVKGNELAGAVPGDTVIAMEFPTQNGGRNREAAVIGILEKSDRLFMGTVVSDGRRLAVYPDKLCAAPLTAVKISCGEVKEGDRVAFSIKRRGDSHFDHLIEIKENFGPNNSAKQSAEAYMLVNAISAEYPTEVLKEAEGLDIEQPDAEDIENRLDLRDEAIFTIDGADTKDIDDAVSIERTEAGYKLGVHIADVSHYVKRGSALDEEAFKRGTSIYYADRVVAMLPKELSNGICSLNPKVDRLAFSCIMNVSKQGELLTYQFRKSVIKSRVKGVYSEVNQILDNSADKEIREKYADVIDRIPIMQELAAVLYANRVNRGAPEIDTPEAKIITNADGVCVDVRVRERGAAEKIIEEFMLMANKAAAALAMREQFPFVYRVHEAPKPEKLVALSETLTALDVNPERIGENSSAADLAEIIRKSRETDKYPVINSIVLRTMMKAKYSHEPLGHYGLVMKEYSHFTSPIRRYSDLAVHRILTDYVNGLNREKLVKKHEKFAVEAALQASNTELAAVTCERECESFYIAEYMQKHVGEEFDGFISGVSPTGIFVQLPNTVEGMIPASKLPPGEYDVQHNVILTGAANGKIFTVGDKIRVKCVSTSISGGFVNFETVEHTEAPKKSSLLDELIK